MSLQNYACDAVHWHIEELRSRVVAESGIPSDRYHFGKVLLQSLKDAPDFILQIDGGTGETETFETGLKRSVQCANALRKIGLKTNDTIVVMAPNHIHLTVPIYAALYLGVGFAGVDMTLKVAELEKSFEIVLPKAVFCQDNKAIEVQEALNNIKHKAEIITYDESDNFLTLSNFLKSGEYPSVADFKPADFDTEKTIANVVPTSGTTGLPKFAALSHKNWSIATLYVWLPHNKFPTPFKMSLTISPIQWLTASYLFTINPIIRITRLQSSSPITPDHFEYLVNKYRPSWVAASPNIFLDVLRDTCDLTCFERFLIGGSAVPKKLIDYIKEASPNTKVQNIYGLSEVGGLALNNINPAPGSCGIPLSSLQYRLVDHVTQEDIMEPHVNGELWLKGPVVFMGYYNNEKNTKNEKTTDGWFKTGDIFYRDDNDNYFFVERLKMLMKYMNHQISPVEIETVIMANPGVLNVAVTKIPDIEKGDLPVACVVRREGCDVTAQEIKDIVNDALTDSKRLRGGVIFMDQLPMTPSMKVNRGKLAQMVLTMKRE